MKTNTQNRAPACERREARGERRESQSRTCGANYGIELKIGDVREERRRGRWEEILNGTWSVSSIIIYRFRDREKGALCLGTLGEKRNSFFCLQEAGGVGETPSRVHTHTHTRARIQAILTRKPETVQVPVQHVPVGPLLRRCQRHVASSFFFVVRQRWFGKIITQMPQAARAANPFGWTRNRCREGRARRSISIEWDGETLARCGHCGRRR